MKRSKFTEKQIIGILREQEAGAKRLKVLEEENARLKRLVAESLLDQAALEDLL